MPRTHGMEEYLEAIYVLHTEGETVYSARLADHLGVSRPTVSQTVRRLAKQGLIELSVDKELVLTPDGREQAETVVRRHRLLERWLTDVLGLDWADAHVEACRLEHAVSQKVENRLFEVLNQPRTCPHGNIIPGSGLSNSKGQALSQAEGSRVYRVVRIVEQAEEDLDLLRFLQQAGIVPGAKVEVLSSNRPFEAGIQVRIEGTLYSLEETVADRVLVHESALAEA